MNDISKLRDTIVPKSDQLNADDLLAGPITVAVVGVKRGDTAEQPISIEIDGGRQPYKPCKSMRRVMIAAWGDDGRKWVGQRMTLYCDPDVKFGGVKVGGIRISHMTGINGRLTVMLTTTRSKRSEFSVQELQAAAPAEDGIASAATLDGLKDAYKRAYTAAKRAGKDTAPIEKAYNDRKAELTAPPQAGQPMTYAEVADALEKAKTRDDFDLACDLIQYVADLQQREELGGIVKRRIAEFKAAA